MKQTQTIALVLGLAAASTGFAQTTTTQGTTMTAPAGVLGQKFVDVNVGFLEVEDFGEDAYGAGVGVNFPIAPSLDLTGGYEYGRAKFSGAKATSHTLEAGATYYIPMNGVKPFVAGELAHSWARTRFGGFQNNDQTFFWDAKAGVEIPVGVALTLTPSISYGDDFEGGDSHDISYHFEANYWISPQAAVYGEVSFTQVHRSPNDIWTFVAGYRWRF